MKYSIKNIKKELDNSQTILLVMPSIEYNDDIVKIVKELSGKSICYVTLNKTSGALIELFKKNMIKTENIVFIDAISKTIKKVPDQDNGVYYVSSPGALTELSLVITKFVKHNFNYLIFDSLTNLLVYESRAPVAKFLSSLVNKIKESKVKAVFYALSVKEQDTLIKESGMFVDKVIDLEKK
ncbi:hypothetical protein J4437_06415 [Candidatus Woesearchaeota archaeon]|nr:hypothetical protein [Candidatus Woesearchaeota archaeon]